ncbi:Aminomethyltransferase [Candidatus Terasakiella magnetica]|uniref:aminomethyltransferase n=1 Tax=Candidatus Terasakiella magnetica TaxID=1867952 RepID=A0A1C3REB7_9PROT|nr:glycine cleavage system aminomethyltransferase GcvT [Candidatus Terasakiella magnetica]SCA55581.1 Aminomethyltransferase [Candidatus Terasakiella magnetica]
MSDDLKTTPLHALHIELGGKMVAFAGYDMPVQYPLGVKNEHLHTRKACGLFDVSHMGQALLKGDDVQSAIETLTPSEIKALPVNGIRYSLLMNDEGGIRDDFMVTNRGDHLYLVVNAACKEADFAHIEKSLPNHSLELLEDRALLALQGPKAAEVLNRFAPGIDQLIFMNMAEVEVAGIPCLVSRSGYTGEDGYEISVPEAQCEELARKLLGEDEVEAIGLGARDSLRLEVGLCLYGSDIDTTTSPIEGSLNWAVGKRRREEGGFPGHDVVMKHLNEGVSRKRVGIKPLGRAPARAHTEIADQDGNIIGEITSGGFGPSFEGPIAMGYVKKEFSKIGTEINLIIRGKSVPAEIAKLPFVPQRYFKG